ncbi:MAG: hypothetical protein HY897_13940 [Deltaproteobacteria bacterium]|nr:hypothetical protein [Deltaproteobacteria bacterium]
MTETTAILVMMNNYVHDMAAGLLVVSAIWMWGSARDLAGAQAPGARELIARWFGRATNAAAASIAVIIATGVVRTIFFMEVEWFPALGRGLTRVLIAKHVVFFALLAAGVAVWIRLRARVRAIPGSVEGNNAGKPNT